MNRRGFLSALGALGVGACFPESAKARLDPAGFDSLPMVGTFSNALPAVPITWEALEAAMSALRAHMAMRLSFPAATILDDAEAHRIEDAVKSAMREVCQPPRYAYVPRGQDVIGTKSIRVVLLPDGDTITPGGSL